jgi:hypothetical protein
MRVRRFDPPFAKVLAVRTVTPRRLIPATVAGTAPALAVGRTLAAAMLAAAIAVAGPSAPAGATTRGQSSPLTTSLSVAGELSGVAATSASSAWAVGSTGSVFSHRPLIVHWNGTSWKQTSSSGLPGGALSAVAATSASNAWAVGATNSGQSLILHWNGTSWKQVPSAGAAGSLTGVGASSATNAWAVGGTSSGQSLILHWNGLSWQRVPSPSSGGRVYLGTVAVLSGRNAWVVGQVVTGTTFAGLILHWTGTAWRRVPSPSPSEGKFGYALEGVAATSATNAWAVGCTDGCPLGGTPLIERWNGTSWRQVAAPTTPYALYNLANVAVSGTRAWAVGGGGPVTSEGAATTYWNGSSWTLSKGISGAELAGVTAISATNAWAVGGTASGRTLILHWNGTTWS